jgi:uncharacterized membrane protein HdeD (DUF308 family)
MTSTLTDPATDQNPMKTVAKDIKAKGRSMKLFGIVTIVLGLVAIVAPILTGLSIFQTVGILVIAGGMMKMTWAFGEDSFGKGLLAFVFGGLTVLSGIVLAANPGFLAGVMTVLLGGYLLADGAVEIIGAFRLSGQSGRGWLLLGGIASILLGVMMWKQFPLSGAWAIGVLLGVKLLFIGMAMLNGGSKVRTLGKRIESLA